MAERPDPERRPDQQGSDFGWLYGKDAPEPSESFDFVGMLMMSPGLALFLYGVSSLPSHGGDVGDPHVWAPALAGLVLMASFVGWSFRPRHPLLDLRLLRNRNLSISLITMFLFAGAFFGGLLLVPTYFQQVRGESTLQAGLLVAPQGLGAMMTMPIAGRLSDRVPIGRIVPVGLALIIVGMFGLTQISDTTPYAVIIVLLLVMGWGMGGTMMPIMTTALRTLRPHEIARGCRRFIVGGRCFDTATDATEEIEIVIDRNPHIVNLVLRRFDMAEVGLGRLLHVIRFEKCRAVDLLSRLCLAKQRCGAFEIRLRHSQIPVGNKGLLHKL